MSEENKISRSANMLTILSAFRIEGFRRENRCSFCDVVKKETMLAMILEGRESGTELLACHACLEAVGYGPLHEKESVK